MSFSRPGNDNSDDDDLNPMSILMMGGQNRRPHTSSHTDQSLSAFAGFKNIAESYEERDLNSPGHLESDCSLKDDGLTTPNSKTKFRDNCRVCGDIASGLHYGISSCEGCKGFFKRSVQMKRQYNCRFYQKCIVNKKTRNSCQACRFQKCISCGMDVDLVRLDRTPGNRRKRPMSDLSEHREVKIISEEVFRTDTPEQSSIGGAAGSSRSTSDSNPSMLSETSNEKEEEPGSPSPSISSTSESSSSSITSNKMEAQDDKKNGEVSERFPREVNEFSKDLYNENCLTEELLMTRLPPDLHALVTNILESRPNVVPVMNNIDSGIITSQTFMNAAYAELEFIVWFAKRQQGFNELYMNDRRQLLRNSFLAIQLVRLSYRSKENGNGKILFARGMELTPEEAVSVSQFPPAIISMNVELIDWFVSLKMDLIEIGLLQVIILASDDADSLMDRPLVRRIQNAHLEALRTYSSIRFPHAPHRFPSLLLRLPFVRKMALLSMEHFLLMIESGQLTMTQLTEELVTSS